MDLDAFTENSVLEFGYCTEFLLRLQTSKIDVDAFETDELIDYLNSVGESVVCFREGTIVKVHVHTMNPGNIINKMQEYGEFLTFKMENMTLQHNENHMTEKLAPKAKLPHKPFGVVRLWGVGAALGNLPSFFGATEAGGLDQLLSGKDAWPMLLYTCIGAPLFEELVCRKLLLDKLHPYGEGYAAISMLDTSSGDPDAIVAELEEVIADVVTGMVSRAVRDTEMNGVAVRKDDFIGFVGDTIHTACETRNEAAVKLCEATNARRYDIMLLVCGSDATDEEAQALCKALKKQYRRTEIVMINGCQPIYDYIIILE